jgi:hypothetical protein
MDDQQEAGNEVSCDGYWGQLKVWGIKPSGRLSKESWLGVDRHGQTVHIDDPEWMTPAERSAALTAIRARYLDLDG